MEHFESLVISLLDSDAMKGVFKKELGNILNIPVIDIGEIWLESIVTDGVVSQELCVSVFGKIKKEDLMKLEFKSIDGNIIIFEVGDTII